MILNIFTGLNIEQKVWRNQKITWPKMVEKLSKENYTNESIDEYLAANKDMQGKIKDVGGYFGGVLKNGRRGKANVKSRQIISLDIDFADKYFWDDFTMIHNLEAVVHGTHKYTLTKPRLRLVIPMTRAVSAEEYEAIVRMLADEIGMQMFDATTFQPARIMYWPSTPWDIDYYVKHQRGDWLDPDIYLNKYNDWADVSTWPRHPSEDIEQEKYPGKKQKDPLLKTGLIGAFCRTYSIQDAIHTFLNDIYIEGVNGAYTYIHGSTSNGLKIYEDKFAYSHHSTDPTEGKTCNAWDLVKLHLFPNTDGKKSFDDMSEFVRQDKDVIKTLAIEQLNMAQADFSEDAEKEVQDWIKELSVTKGGKIESTAPNISIILSNDENLKDRFKRNQFDYKNYIMKSVPWREIDKPEPVRNVDYSGVRNYIETVYGVSGNLKIDDAMNLEFERGSFHPVRDYLKGLKWDGTERIKDILPDYFNVKPNIYTEEAMRKTMVGAVARIMNPGTKFDLVLMLVGKQGTYKSEFLAKLAKGWGSHSFNSVSGKESFEQLQGSWIMEIAELSGVRKAEVESVKHYLSKTEDTFRPAYGRVSETYKRQTVFIGTTNESMFLKDPTGNRRFMPVEVSRGVKSVWLDMNGDIDQWWAEAVKLYQEGETLYLSDEAEKIAYGIQHDHMEVDERLGIIESYLNQKLPSDWGSKSIEERVEWNRDGLLDGFNGIQRDYVCAAEIWCECYGQPRGLMTRFATKEINILLNDLTGWEKNKGTKRFKHYGTQRYYKRKGIRKDFEPRGKENGLFEYQNAAGNNFGLSGQDADLL